MTTIDDFIIDDFQFSSLLNKECKIISYKEMSNSFNILLQNKNGSEYYFNIKKPELDKFLNSFSPIKELNGKPKDEERFSKYFEPTKEEVKQEKKIKASDTVAVLNKTIDHLDNELVKTKRERTDALLANADLKDEIKELKKKIDDLKENSTEEIVTTQTHEEQTIYSIRQRMDDLISKVTSGEFEVDRAQCLINASNTYLETLKIEHVIEGDWEKDYEANNLHYSFKRKLIKFIQQYSFPQPEEISDKILQRIKETFICTASHRLIKPIFDVHGMVKDILNISREDVLDRIFKDYDYLQSQDKISEVFMEWYLDFETEFEKLIQ